MQRPVQGMMGTDQHILRLLSDAALALRVGDIQYNLAWKFDVEVPESTLYRRLGTMAYADLLIQVDDDPARYAISELGERYGDGELTDAQSLDIEAAYDEYEY